MTKELILQRTIKAINQLPEAKAEEIADFADFLNKRYEEDQIKDGIHMLTDSGASFRFLSDEEDLYTIADLKEKYNE